MKDSSLNKIILLLQEKIGADKLRIVDHWDGDNCAIGVTNNFQKKLVYISTYNKKTDEFYVELESSSEDASVKYIVDSSFDNVNIGDLEKLIRQHLSL